MILLFGGTSDTAPIAQALAEAGYLVLVSTLTDEDLNVGSHPAIRRRIGRLDRRSMTQVVLDEHIAAIVDATHPYAVEVRATAREVAAAGSIPYFTFVRPAALVKSRSEIWFARDHTEAADLAVRPGRPVLLTTGSRNLAPYVAAAASRSLPLFARVLPRPESIQACLDAGIPRESILALKGPFNMEENLAHIRQCGAGVMVSKDSGEAGGVNEKLLACSQSQCRLIIVERPALPLGGSFDRVERLIEAVHSALA